MIVNPHNFKGLKKIGIAGLLLAGVVVTQSAVSSALFSDTENTKLEIETGVLDFYLSEHDWSKDKLEPGKQTKREVKVKDAGWVDFIYDVKAEITGGHGPLCAALYIRAKRENTVVYDGPLAGLNSQPRSSTHLDDDWEFIVTLPSDANNFGGKDCRFKLVFSGWQEGLEVGEGFFDIETLSNNLSVKEESNHNHNGDDEDNDHWRNSLELPELPDLTPNLPELPDLPEIPKPDTGKIKDILDEQQQNLEETKEDINDITDTQDITEETEEPLQTEQQSNGETQEPDDSATSTAEIIIENPES